MSEKDDNSNGGGSRDGWSKQQQPFRENKYKCEIAVNMVGPVEYFHGDPETMAVASLAENKKKCKELFGENGPNEFEHKIYVFDKLDMISVLRDRDKEIDVAQYEYEGGGPMCYMIGEDGFKKELITKGCIYLHENLYGSPVKLFGDIDYTMAKSNITEKFFDSEDVRIRSWIKTFKLRVENALERAFSSLKKESHSKKKSKTKKKNAEWEHAWSIQTAFRRDMMSPKISYHVINNSRFNGKQVLFKDVTHLDMFLRNQVLLTSLIPRMTPDECSFDQSFTFKHKSIRCVGAAKRGDPQRIFIPDDKSERFEFGCVQPGNLYDGYYVITTRKENNAFDRAYPEENFPGAIGGRQKNDEGTFSNSEVSALQGGMYSEGEKTTANEFIEMMVGYMSGLEKFSYLSSALQKNKFPYTAIDIKYNADRTVLMISIGVAAGMCCIMNPKHLHNNGKKSSSSFIIIRRIDIEDDYDIEIHCLCPKLADHPMKFFDVSHTSCPRESKGIRTKMFARAKLLLSDSSA